MLHEKQRRDDAKYRECVGCEAFQQIHEICPRCILSLPPPNAPCARRMRRPKSQPTGEQSPPRELREITLRPRVLRVACRPKPDRAKGGGEGVRRTTGVWRSSLSVHD